MSLGITIVSHVYEVANGLPRLLTEDNDVGTSMEKIMNAFEENDADEILSFYDLGSAKMNLEMAIEMTDKKVHLYDVALIEGAYTAATLLEAGVDLQEVEKQLEPLKIK